MCRAETSNLPVPRAQQLRAVADPRAWLEQRAPQLRGLKGGQELLRRARCSYLGAQWSGPDDRRPEPGLITRTRL